jgi:hypothetical protein
MSDVQLSQHPLSEQREIDIATADHDSDALSSHSRPLLQQGPKRRRTSAFNQVVRINPIGPHGIGDFIVGYSDDTCGPRANDGERIRIWLPHRDSISMRFGPIDGDHSSFSERLGIRCRASRLHADDLGVQTQQIACQNRSAAPNALIAAFFSTLLP